MNRAILDPKNTDEALPIELPIGHALGIYLKRLGILIGISITNLLVLGAIVAANDATMQSSPLSSFWDYAQLAVILGTVLTILVLILLSLPASRVKPLLMKASSAVLFITSGILTLYIISPIDFIPDFIPLLGQLDDTAASITALISAVGGIIMYTQARSSLPPSPSSSTPRIEPPKEK